MGKHCLILFTLIIVQGWAFGQNVPVAQSAPIIDPFSLSQDQAGVISNSVNLLTGDTSIPLTLVSIPGGEGLATNVSLFYSSANIENQATTWNLDAPTGITGLGWSMSYPQIIVDNKQTGAREDDDFYLVENGSPSPLICIGISSGVKTYKTKMFSSMVITYTAATERWDVILENGNKLVYGDQNSGRSTVQWIPTWGNWLGSSNQSTNQRQGIAWNLSEMTNTWGDKITYSYQNAENLVMPFQAAYQTEASYLSKITDTQGHEVDLVYNSKLAEEFMEPHTEQNEPDAYPERYERNYLDRIIVKGDGTSYYEIHFRYAFMTLITPVFGNATKRLLSSIAKISSTGQQVPPMNFGYQSTSGLLTSITTPASGTVTFDYTGNIMPNWTTTTTPTKLYASAPSGYAEGLTFIEDDYTIVTWRQLSGGSHTLSASPIKIMAYTYDGRWLETDLNAPQYIYTDVKKLGTNANTGPQDFLVSTQKDFFAILLQDYSVPADHGAFDLYIWKKDEAQHGKWLFYSDRLFFGTSYDATKRQLFTGNDFVAVSDNLGHIYRYVWTGTSGSASEWARTTVTESTGTHFTTATNNYIISHNTAPNPDQVTLYYLDEQKNWAPPISNSTPPWGNEGGKSVWRSNNSLAIVKPSGSANGYVCSWDKAYSAITFTTLPGFTYSGPFVPLYLSGTMAGVSTKTLARAYRFNGVSWVDSGAKTPTPTTDSLQTAYGEDMFTWIDVYPSRGTSSYIRFNPGANTWSSEVALNSYTALTELGYNYFVYNSTLNVNKPDGNVLTQSLSAPWNNGSFPSPVFPSYILDGSKIFYVQNGSIKGTASILGTYVYAPNLVGDVTYMVGRYSFAERGSGFYYDCTSIRLQRVDTHDIGGSFVDYPLTKITVNDGIKNYYTSYKYETATASYDPQLQTVFYNKVTTVNGSDVTTSKPYGYTETYFFNGMSESELGDTFPNLNSIGQSSGNFILLTGQVYRTKAYDSNATPNLVKEVDLTYAVDINSVFNGSGSPIGITFKPWPVGVVTTQDGIQTQRITTLNGKGQILSEQDLTLSGVNLVEQVNVSYTYGWEVYPNSLLARNILPPLYQVTRTVDGQVVESQVTRYKEDWPCAGPNCPYSTAPAAYDQFSWLGTNTSTFSWPNVVTQSPSADWGFSGMTTGRDSYNGVITERKFKGNQFSSKIWDQYKRNVIATVQNSSFATVAYTSFEDASQGNWSWSDGSIATGTSKTGNRYFNLGTVGMTKTGLNTADQYTVSFWSNLSNGSVTITGVAGVVNLGTLSGWTFFQYTVTNVASVTISRNGSNPVQLDEVRILPASAQMATSSFDPLFGPTSETNVNHQTMYLVYDSFGRRINILNENSNIVKNIIYNSLK